MTAPEMFGTDPTDVFYMIVGTRLVMLAFTFPHAPKTLGPCCLPYQDKDQWRVEVCAEHARMLS